MTTLIIIIAVLVGLGLGLLLVGLGVFFWKLLKIIASMEKASSEMMRAMEPLLKSGALAVLAKSSQTISADLAKLIQSISGMNRSLRLFNQGLFKDGTAEPGITEETVSIPVADEAGFAPEGTSSHYSYSEEKQAESEYAEGLRMIGVETDHRNIKEPTPKQMHGSNL